MHQRQAAEKIRNLDELASEIATLRAKGKRVVHCHGVFDLMHLGHVKHLEAAKAMGDVLVVTLTPDAYVNKGPGRPAFTQDHRAQVIAALGCVDFVAVNRWPAAVETIRLLRPDLYVKGSDYRDASKDVTGGIALEEQAARAGGGKLAFTDELTFSSTTLINRHFSTLPKEVTEFLAGFTSRHSAEQVVRYLEGARSLKVLVVGETIIDDYHYCETLGKSGKEPILAVRFVSSEKFAGGAAAVANHVAALADHVGLVSFLGQEDSHEDFCRSKLSNKVNATFLYMAGAPTIVKRRYVESYPFQKMFEVYQMKEDAGEAANAQRLCETLDRHLPEYDLVIVADYGHGMIGPEAVEVLCKKARCLAVNTQANAANHGFNTVSKYQRADYICVSENELRLEARQRRQNLDQLVRQIGQRLGCRRATITCGRRGMLCYDQSGQSMQVPALADHFTDRVGAGDAVFAITAMCMAQDAPAEVMGLVGNAVGAMAVGIVGNRSAIDRAALIKSIVSLLR